MAVVAMSGEFRLDRGQPAEVFFSGSDIERMNALKVFRRVFAYGNHINGAVRTAGTIDDTSGSIGTFTGNINNFGVIAGGDFTPISRGLADWTSASWVLRSVYFGK